MKITYDKIAQAVYIYLSEVKVAKTLQLNNRTIVDLDEKGGIVGIEILEVSISLSSLQTNFAQALQV